ncbi:MAG: ABC transporter permease [Clostridia bacterium]|nr:ABC transporter permease [Clostridia bacterium]
MVATSVLREKIRILNRNRVFFPILSLLALFFIASLISPHFLSSTNIKNVASQLAIGAILAIGEATVIIGGGIDLSVGSVLAIAGSINAILMKWYETSIPLAFVAALLVGCFAGFLNGVIVVKVRIPSFIVTLAMAATTRGLTLVVTGGKPVSGFVAPFRSLAGYLGPIPVLFLIATSLAIVWQLVLSYTRFGRHLYATGGNELASRLVGLNVDRVKIIVFTFSGFCAALAGVLLNARLNAAYPTAGEGYELDAIAAAVLGGVSFSGGIGSVAGAYLGAIIMTILGNILNLLKVAAFYQYVAKGIILALAAISLSRGVKFAK